MEQKKEGRILLGARRGGELSAEEWAEKEREGGRFERRDLPYLLGVHAPL